MSIRSAYPPVVVTFGIITENRAIEANDRVLYLDYHGEYDEWDDAKDLSDAATWWYYEIQRLFPGVTSCEHGMSLQGCYGQAHYASDDEIERGW